MVHRIQKVVPLSSRNRSNISLRPTVCPYALLPQVSEAVERAMEITDALGIAPRAIHGLIVNVVFEHLLPVH